MSNPTPEKFLRELLEDFQETLSVVRKDLTPQELAANCKSWLEPFNSVGLPVHKGAKLIMLATLYQVLDLADKMDPEEFEEYLWNIFVALLDSME